METTLNREFTIPSISEDARNKEILPGIFATESQAIALNDLIKFTRGEKGLTYLLSGFAGCGKAQPLTEPVLTPDGWQPMGEIVVGSEVIGGDGQPTKVLGTYQHDGVKTYKVTFCDGTFTYCCEDHLWKVSTPKQKATEKHSILPLKDLLPKIGVRKSNKAQHWYSIPLTKPVNYAPKEFSMNPYLLGWLIGDGCLFTPGSPSCDISVWVNDYEEVFNLLNPLIPEKVKFTIRKRTETVKCLGFSRSIKPILQSLGLAGKYSKDKFIPKEYFLGSIEQRKELLAGLLDTDGSVKAHSKKRVKTAFFSSSCQLANDVAELVRSLGGYSIVRKEADRGKGEEYKVSIRLWFNPFKLSRKANEYGDYTPTVKKVKKMVKAEYIGRVDSQCIYVESPEHLYLTKDYIVTHNTMLVQALIKRMRDEGDNRKIVFTAPTNKATGVLAKMVSRWGLEVECLTCASLLGLKPSWDAESGKEIFARDYKEESSIQTYDLVVIDEASMVSQDLFNFLMTEVTLTTRLLFMGDPYQLPPVGEAISESFTEIGDQSNLNEVMRYEGAIADVVTDVRTNLSRKEQGVYKTSIIDNEGVFCVGSRVWTEQLIKAFQSNSYIENADAVRALAYTNKRVEQINKIVRDEIRGDDAPRFVIGERLIAKKHFYLPNPYGKDLKIFSTADEMEVLNVHEGKSGHYKHWMLTLNLFSLPGRPVTVPVLHEDSERDFNHELDSLKKMKNWKGFYGVKGRFADLRYAYAVTVHQSQGSTFENCFVDLPNVMKDRTRNMVRFPGAKEEKNIYEKNQLLYVGFSRASRRLFVLN